MADKSGSGIVETQPEVHLDRVSKAMALVDRGGLVSRSDARSDHPAHGLRANSEARRRP
jgi:hypothetical protein